VIDTYRPDTRRHRVLVVDADRGVRASLADLLECGDRVEVVG
jgi:hypothetical protein